MSVVQAEGFAVPFDEDGQPYPQFGETRFPALHSFYLGWDVGDNTPGDREVTLIQVLAGGESEDLSPDAALEPAKIPDGRLEVALQDAHASGEEFFYRVSHALLTTPGARRFQIRDVGCVGQCVRRLPSEVGGGGPIPPSESPLIALVGFKLFFTGGADHHLDRVGVWFRGDELHVALRDKNGDDTFGYLVDFVVLPRMSLNVTTGIQRGRASGGQRVHFPTPLKTDFLLTGWAVNFVGDVDHEIRDLGVDRRGDDFTVFYSDKNADDRFDWRVEWAHVGPLVVHPAQPARRSAPLSSTNALEQR
jgi:hypothetical protein